ncbi:MAG: hypothetical protein IKU89_00870, partial [Oscillospiraceae bacterium]|nr:hypothetical protein [Oscillospiraceae bacterium]
MNARKIKRKAKGLMKYFKREYQRICENGSKSSSFDFFADNYHTVFEACEYCLHIESSAFFSDTLEPAQNITTKCGDKFMATDELLEVLRASNATPNEIEFLKAELSLYLLLELKKALQNGLECQKQISLLADISRIDQSKIIKALSSVDFWLSDRQSYKDSSDETKHRIRQKILKSGENAENKAKSLSSLSEEEFIKNVFTKTNILPRKAVFSCYTSLLFIASVLICVWLGSAVFDMWALLLILPVFGALRSVFDSLLIRLLPDPELPKLSSSSFKVQSERCLIVLSVAVGDASSAEALQKRLLKLHLANPQPNISVVALVDLFAECTPTTTEDKAVLNTLQEVIAKLN